LCWYSSMVVSMPLQIWLPIFFQNYTLRITSGSLQKYSASYCSLPDGFVTKICPARTAPEPACAKLTQLYL